MADQENTQTANVQDASGSSEAKQRQQMERQLRDLKKKLKVIDVYNRLHDNDAYFDSAMKRAANSVQELGERTPLDREAVIAETASALIWRPSIVSPEAWQAYDDDVEAVDIRDLLAILFSPADKPMSLDEADEFEKAQKGDRDISEIAYFLRQQRLLESQGVIHPQGTMTERTSRWRNSEEGKSAFNAKGLLTVGRYTLMAGILVGTGGAAAPGMVAAHYAKTLNIPGRIGNAGQKLADKSCQWLVDKGVVSPAAMGTFKERLNEMARALTQSKLGTFGRLVASVAVVGGAGYLLNETVGFDRVGEAWKDLVGFTDNSLESQFESEIPQAAQEAQEAEAARLDDPYTPAYDVPNGISAEEGAVIHPFGGVDRDALIDHVMHAGVSTGQVNAFIEHLSQMPAQLTESDLRDAAIAMDGRARFVGSGTLIDMAADRFGLSADALRSGLSNEILPAPPVIAEMQEVTSSDLTDEQLNAFQNSVDVANQVAQGAAIDAGPDSPTPDISAEGSDPNAGSASEEVTGAETPGSQTVSVEVPAGSSLSEVIWEQYRDAGITLSASELYAPSELSEHPGGLVGQMADANQLSNPDVVAEGAKLSITLEGLPPEPDSPELGTATVEAESDLEISPEAIAAAKAVMAGGQEVSSEAIAAAVAVSGSEHEAAHLASVSPDEAAPTRDWIPDGLAPMEVNEEFLQVEGVQYLDEVVTVAAGVAAANITCKATGLDKDLAPDSENDTEISSSPTASGPGM